DDELTGRDPSYWQTWQDRVAAVTSEDVLRVAKEHLDPERLVVLVVGDWQPIAQGDGTGRAKMTEFGEVRPLAPRDPLTPRQRPPPPPVARAAARPQPTGRRSTARNSGGPSASGAGSSGRCEARVRPASSAHARTSRSWKPRCTWPRVCRYSARSWACMSSRT